MSAPPSVPMVTLGRMYVAPPGVAVADDGEGAEDEAAAGEKGDRETVPHAP